MSAKDIKEHVQRAALGYALAMEEFNDDMADLSKQVGINLTPTMLLDFMRTILNKRTVSGCSILICKTCHTVGTEVGGDMCNDNGDRMMIHQCEICESSACRDCAKRITIPRKGMYYIRFLCTECYNNDDLKFTCTHCQTRKLQLTSEECSFCKETICIDCSKDGVYPYPCDVAKRFFE